jgi:protein-S-isoprenylcysteine O-methyltransferase Ste14
MMTLASISFDGILMLISGRWLWLEGWLINGMFGRMLAYTGVWTDTHAPELSDERMQAIAQPGSLHERLILDSVVFLVVVTLIVAALDGGRFGWLVVPLWVEMIGFGLFAAYIVLNWWAAVTNPSLSAATRIQQARDHRVVASGPYRIIRHPMYAGVILGFLGLPLALGSWWALIPSGLLTGLFVLRTALEDQMLLRQLTGYAAYAQRTRYRLLPGIW